MNVRSKRPMRGWWSPFAAAMGLLATATVPEARAAPANTLYSADPLTVYVARGIPDICGLGCSEWIVAEGRFGVGSADKFRALLTRLGKQKLPVFFNSPGGLGTRG